MIRFLKWFDQKLEFKIFSLISIILILSFGVIYVLVTRNEEKNLFKNEAQKSELVANTIHETLERSMMAFRADVIRELMGDLKKLDGVVRIQIIRGDAPYVGSGVGKEEAFMDSKTLQDVKKRVPSLYKTEWERNHTNMDVNVGEGTSTPEFRKNFARFTEELGKGNFIIEKKPELMRGLLDVSYFETIRGRKALTYLRPLPNFPRCALCHGSGYQLRGILMISTDTTDVFAALTETKRSLFMVNLTTILILLLLLRFLIRRVVLRPLGDVGGHLKAIAEGGGDLTQRIGVGYRDEIGAVARWFNLFIEKLQQIISRVSSTSIDVRDLSQEILKDNQNVVERANLQLNSIDETTKAIEKMNLSLKEVAENSDTLKSMADESSVAVIEMSSSIDEIARNTSVLSSSVEETTSSIIEMSSSSKEIDENVTVLDDAAQTTMSLMVNMSSSIKQIQGNIHETVRLSEGVMSDAEKGQESAKKTIQGIEKIKNYSDEVNKVIQNLQKRTESIGNILNVIDEVAEQTNLLALNAAIIAAQAGVHGKSFGVVAQEIKELAERTGTSTKEIHDIITALQGESTNAVRAIQGGAKSVEAGVRLSREVGDALNQILENSKQSTIRVQEIARSADEQTKGVKGVSKAMERVSDLTRQIARATGEQSKGSGLIIKETGKMRDISINVKSAIHQQSLGNKRINEISEKVTRRVKEIAQSTGSLAHEITTIVSSAKKIRKIIGENVDANGKVGLAVEEMLKQANRLYDQISKFKY